MYIYDIEKSPHKGKKKLIKLKCKYFGGFSSLEDVYILLFSISPSQQNFFTADILTCHKRKSTGVIDNMNNNFIPFR